MKKQLQATIQYAEENGLRLNIASSTGFILK
ncbi:hypothetical protein [Paenibacillus sp. JJ-223]